MLGFFIAGRADESKELLAYTDGGREADPVKLLGGGDPRRKGDVVPVGYLSMLPRLARAVELPPADAKTTHRRTQLAKWITDPANPLTPRVAVNRLWLHHFGEGLCRTADNFGVMGTAPTHPELLDWLAADFVEHGWQAKRLHKMILMSSAVPHGLDPPATGRIRDARFRQRTLVPHESAPARGRAAARRDAGRQRRVELEGGRSELLPHGQPRSLEGLSKKGADWKQSSPHEQNRRSVYMFTKRSLLLPLMTVFDFADTTLPCAQRNISTVAPQALALLNNEFVHAQSDALAERVVREAGSDAIGADRTGLVAGTVARADGGGARFCDDSSGAAAPAIRGRQCAAKPGGRAGSGVCG